jgi:hypothetical protein
MTQDLSVTCCSTLDFPSRIQNTNFNRDFHTMIHRRGPTVRGFSGDSPRWRSPVGGWLSVDAEVHGRASGPIGRGGRLVSSHISDEIESTDPDRFPQVSSNKVVKVAGFEATPSLFRPGPFVSSSARDRRYPVVVWILSLHFEGIGTVVPSGTLLLVAGKLS